jgi:hypothetical protein
VKVALDRRRERCQLLRVSRRVQTLGKPAAKTVDLLRLSDEGGGDYISTGRIEAGP